MDQAAEHASQLTALVLGIMVLMLFAALTAVLSSRLPKLPFTIALVLLGIILAGLARQFPAFAMFAQFELTPELVLFVFLPTLIYESAYSLDARQLQRNLVPVLTLAVPGLLLSTAIIGGIFHAFT
jgi:CPA1 family monovalent cation:H+ antiporter